MKYYLILLTALACMLVAIQPAVANDEPGAQRRTAISQCCERMAQLQQSNETGHDGLPEIQEYLHQALQAVYTAKVQAGWDLGADLETTNRDLTTLVSLGYLPNWPGNPLAGFQPMRILGPADASSPGDLMFSLCPSAYYTTNNNRPLPISFEVDVYGPEGAEQFGRIVQHAENSAWSTPPQGALYGLSFYFESDRANAARMQRMKEKYGGDKLPAA